MGTIMRRGKSYVVVMSRGRDPLTGKRRRDWHSGFRTRSEAVRAEAELASRMNRGLYVEPTRLRLGDYLIETWLPSISETVRESTLSSYSHNVRRHIVPHLGHVAVQELSGRDLNRLYAHLRRAGRLDGRGGLAPKTVHSIHTILHRALRDAVRWNLVSRNIAEAADPPNTSRAKEFRTWSRSELREFLAGVSTDRLFAAFVTAASTGFRRGELLGLRWFDVDLDGRRLSIRQSLISIEYEVRISEPKTSRGRRTVAIDPATTDALRAHRKNQTLDRLSAES